MTLSALLSPPVAGAVAGFVAQAVRGAVIAAVAPGLAVPLAVGGAVLTAQAAWYYWNSSLTEQAQQLAMERFCIPNGSSNHEEAAARNSLCGLGFTLSYYSTNNRKWFGTPVGGFYDTSGYYLAEEVNWTTSEGYEIKGRRIYLVSQTQGVLDYGVADPATITETPNTPKPWSEWTDTQRTQAVGNLTPQDWQQLAGSMPVGAATPAGSPTPNDIILTGDPALGASQGTQVIPAGTIVGNDPATPGTSPSTGSGAGGGTGAGTGSGAGSGQTNR